MLTRLSREQITEYWKVIGPSVSKALPNPSIPVMENVLKSLYSGKMQCWAYIGGDNKLIGLVTTTVLEDEVAMVKKLLIYSVSGIDKVDLSVWNKGLNTLIDFARSNDCGIIVAYTMNPKVANLVKRLKGSVEFYLTLGVGKNEDIQQISS